MNGYLQRLVSSVQTPRAAIRPMLGSLFSASMSENTPNIFQEVDEVTVSGPTEYLATPGPQAPRATQRAPELGPAGHDLPHVQTRDPVAQAAQPSEGSRRVTQQPPPAIQPARELRPAGRDLRPAQTRTPAAQAAAQGEGSRPISEARTSIERLVTEGPLGRDSVLKTNGERVFSGKPIASTDPGPERADQLAFPRRPYRPLLAESLTGAEPRDLRLLGPLTFDIGKDEKADTSRRVARPEREADEIQIHIGRVEVTAVPPAPTHRGPQPARKSLSLKEYLKRGREKA